MARPLSVLAKPMRLLNHARVGKQGAGSGENRVAGHMGGGASVHVRYFRLSEPLLPYFTSLYLFDITVPPGERIADCLFPEWAALRFRPGIPFRSELTAAELEVHNTNRLWADQSRIGTEDAA